MLIVSQSTGVSMEILSELLKDGRLQVPPDSNIFLKCEKCGCAIRSGRICSRCSVNTFQEIRNLLTEDTRKKANEKSDEHSEKKIRESVGKMRFVKRK